MSFVVTFFFWESKVKTLIYLCDLVFMKSNFKISHLIVAIFSFQLEREKTGDFSTTEIVRLTYLCFVHGWVQTCSVSSLFWKQSQPSLHHHHMQQWKRSQKGQSEYKVQSEEVADFPEKHLGPLLKDLALLKMWTSNKRARSVFPGLVVFPNQFIGITSQNNPK